MAHQVWCGLFEGLVALIMLGFVDIWLDFRGMFSWFAGHSQLGLRVASTSFYTSSHAGPKAIVQ